MGKSKNSKSQSKSQVFKGPKGGGHKSEHRPAGKKGAGAVGSKKGVGAATAQRAPQQRVAPVHADSLPSFQPPSSTSSGGKPLSALQQKFKAKLEGARFRTINEKLYTQRGEDAYTDFQTEPDLFDVVSILYLIFSMSETICNVM
jgi:hypothetical protein